MALKQLKKNKAPDADGITAELLKAVGELILKALLKLLNSMLGGKPHKFGPIA